ncbi:MAG: hypothetical protein KAS21_03255 [Candidatus Aminicenantes bacterium]|nr:hypothetical protein [Candidatus Aminicenantes bacterium]
MKLLKTAILLIIFVTFQLHSVIPMYYGARSLSLGYSSSAFNYDFNSVFLNPGLLSGYGYFISGYQHQSDYSSYKEFGESLSDILQDDLTKFETFGINNREAIHNKLEQLFSSKHGMYGFSSNSTGAAFKRYGVAVSFVNLAVVNPERTSILDNDIDLITGDDLKDMNMNITGLSYTQYSLSYSLDITKEVSLGVTVHYLSGKVSEFSIPLINDEFNSSSEEKDYLKYGWLGAENNFGLFLADFSISAVISPMFRASVILKNYKNPVIEFNTGEIELSQRIIAAVSFRPDQRTGIYIDMDVKKSDLYLNGEDVQPVSLGVERSFFNGRFFARAGIMSDLTEKYLFGGKGKLLYGLGLGIYINKVLIDAGLGIGGDGKVSSIAVSGFFIVR